MTILAHSEHVKNLLFMSKAEKTRISFVCDAFLVIHIPIVFLRMMLLWWLSFCLAQIAGHK